MKLYIPRDREAHGIQVIGVKGSRKSTIIRQLVYQAYGRRWPVVFLDMNRDLLEEFYQEGDWLIDFGDTRGCRWMTSREAIDEPHAMPIGEAAFPNEQGRQFFFQDHARAIIAYLIGVHHPTTSELARWLQRPEMLDKLLAGTEHAETMTKNSAEQRAGIIGTLNHIGRTMRWLPDNDGDREFSVIEWCQKRRGSIFLSSLPYSFPALKQIHALILDMLLLGMQTYPGPCLVVADEIGVYPKSEQVARSAATIRKSGAVVVLAYQDYTQLENTYGDKLADSIASNNYTSIILRNTSPKSADFTSKLIGMPQEVERIRESKPASIFHRGAGRRNYSTERTMISAVTPGEIQSLEDGEGYISAAGKITKIQVDWMPPVKRAPRLIERIITSPAQQPIEFPSERIPYRKSRSRQTSLAQ